MLNNLTNFFNLIVGRRIKTQLEPSDLIAVGTKQSPALGDYKPTAIKFEDLQAQVLPSVDGVTITGTGLPGDPLVASIPSSAVNYSNVVFVDSVNGNNSTALINRFDKPFLTIVNALTAAAALSGISADNRALVYIRRGNYSGVIVNLQNNVDIYCEAGVVFSGASVIRDNGIVVNANIYGHLKMNTWVGTTPPFRITAASVVSFEFDSISSQPAAIEIIPSAAGGRVTISGNYIYSNTLGQGYGITIRNSANVIMNIKNAIEGIHSVLNFRNFTGTGVVNCPNINLVAGNIYGGNFKQAFLVNEAATTGTIKITANFNDLDTLYYGGVSAVVRLQNNPNTNLTINGDVNSVWNPAMVLAGNLSNVTYTGKITTTREAISVSGNTKVNVKNSTIVRTTDTVAGPIGVNNSASLYLDSCTIYSAFTDGNIINIESNTASLYIKDVTAEGVGFNYFVNTGAAAPTTGLINAYSNKPNSPGFVNAYTVAGSFIQDASINVPKF